MSVYRDPEPEKSITTFEARRRIKLAPGVFAEPGHNKSADRGALVPQAVLWPRHEAWVHTGHLREVQVTPAEFEEAMDNAIPPLSEGEQIRIREFHGIGEAYGVRGPHKQPFTRTQVLKEAEADRIAAAQLEISGRQGGHVELTGPVPVKTDPRPRSVRSGTTVKRVAPAVKRAPRKRPVKAK